MKKGDKPNAAEEFLYKLFSQPKFNEYLANYRKRAGIPKDGLGKTKNWKKEWNLLINDPKKAFVILVATEHLQTKFKIPVVFTPFIRFYFCFGYVPKEFSKRVNVAKICPPIHLLNPEHENEEEEIQTYFPYEPYAKLLIFGTSRKSDVIEFIEKNWNKVESVMKRQGWVRPKMVRRTIYKRRNLRIKELNRKTLKELQKEADPDGTYYEGFSPKYKHLVIQKILKKEGYGEVNDGYIRKIAYKG